MATGSSSHKSFPAAEVERAVGSRPVRWVPVYGGYGLNKAHWRARLADGRSTFVKLALEDDAAEWIRAEIRFYAALRAPFLPELLGSHDGHVTLLVLEDLSAAHWPPPWRAGEVESVLATLQAVAATRPPPGVLPALEDERRRWNGWLDIAEDPRPFLATGLASADWLREALPVLREAGETCRLAGDSLVHLDVRSDNLCLRDGEVLLVDWNLACVGNPLLDVAFWLPSLTLEGGPQPWELLPDTQGLVALVAGYFASRAGLPVLPEAPRVRGFQRAQAEVALPWAARELGLTLPA
jgi:Phosphotransferase enzyme family